LEGLPVACVDQNPGIDEQFDKLVEELESTPVGKQDAASFLIMNPFDSSLTHEEMFIVDSDAEMTYLRAQTAIDLKLGKSISFTTKYGNGQLSLGYKSAITVEISSPSRPHHINITVAVDSAVDRSILSKHFMEIAGFCHCPRVGLMPCK
jgi:hypothetical protein